MDKNGTALCGKCFIKYKAAGYMIETVQKLPNQKVTCAECRKRRYGGIYRVKDKRKEASA